MDFATLQKLGAIVPKALVKREITFKRPELRPDSEWADQDVPEFTGELLEESMTIHIRRGSSADAIDVSNASDRERPFVAIYRSICDEAGNQVFPSLEEAMQLQMWMALPLFTAINEINGGGSKNSRPRTSSGAKSRSPSAEGRSPNGKKPCSSTNKTSGDNTATSAGA